MKILVINGSPKKERSDTMHLTNTFLEAMGETAEIITTIDSNVSACRGCYACWHKTPGKCALGDDMSEILRKIREADLVIWSFPLYCYSFPSSLKAVIDRLLPLTTSAQRVDEDGSTYHPQRDETPTRHMVISGCGFPEIKNNYDGLIFQIKMIFGKETPMILCCEAPLLALERSQIVAKPYLEKVKKAGEEFKATGNLSKETQESLWEPMFSPEMYRKIASSET